MDLQLIRDTYNGEQTLGKIECAEQNYYADSVECPWMLGSNAPRISAIPEGLFEIVLYDSPRLGEETMLLKDVPGRSMIEIHPANWVIEPKSKRRLLEGCIAPGFGRINEEALPIEPLTGVAHSRMAWLALRELVRQATRNGDRVWITIRNVLTLDSDSGSSIRV